MKKKVFIYYELPILIITMILVVYPTIEIKKDNKLYYFTYSEDTSKFEDKMCYDESYAYNKKQNISITKWDYKSFLFFKLHILSYEEGNICETEYILEESYIYKFINQAIIKENKNNIDLKKLIQGKTPIIRNKRYPWNDNYYYIGYILEGKPQEMYIYTNEDHLLIIQVGNSDEGPKYIAYK